MAELICLRSVILLVSLAFFLAGLIETKTMLESNPITAITTNNSIKVNPFFIFSKNL